MTAQTRKVIAGPQPASRNALAALLVLWLIATIYPDTRQAGYPLLESTLLAAWVCWPLLLVGHLLRGQSKKLLRTKQQGASIYMQFLLAMFWTQCAVLMAVNVVASQVIVMNGSMGERGLVWVFLPLALVKFGIIVAGLWAVLLYLRQWWTSR